MLALRRAHRFGACVRRLHQRAIVVDDGVVKITGSSDMVLPFIWLRDSCQCPRCVHPSSQQKLHSIHDLDVRIRPVTDGVRATESGLSIQWAGEDNHITELSEDFLKTYSHRDQLVNFHKDEPRQLWDKTELQKSDSLFLDYTAFRTDPATRLRAYKQLLRYGLLFFRDMPHEHKADDTCELRALAGNLGELRTTFYGDVWDVKNKRNSRNIAYTNLDLGLHMDLM